jgi:hypothetical protein
LLGCGGKCGTNWKNKMDEKLDVFWVYLDVGRDEILRVVN